MVNSELIRRRLEAKLRLIENAFFGILAAFGVWGLFGVLIATKCDVFVEVDSQPIHTCYSIAFPPYVYVIVGIISLLAAIWVYKRNQRYYE